MNGKVCVKCQIELRPKTNGVLALEMADFGPYKLWQADLWHCTSCGLEVILGAGAKPIAEHYETTIFAEAVEKADRGQCVFRFWMDAASKDSRFSKQETANDD